MPRELFAAACLISLAVACAPLAQAQDNSPSAVSLVDQTCTQVMGLRRGETYFARCRESLSQALPAPSVGLAMAATADQAHPLAIAYTGGTEAGKSFYDVAPGVRWNRERYACAQLGLLPGSTSFGQCVFGLDGAFLPDQN